MSSHHPEHCVVLQRPQHRCELKPGRDIEWEEALDGASPVACQPLEAGDPLYILYTSGTTGKPKGVVRDNGGHAVALAWSMKHVYGVKPGEVFWAASDGERLDPDTYHWVRSLLGCPVIDHWWQTETGWPVAANCIGVESLPIKPGSVGRPVPGYVVEILDEEGRPQPAEREGSVVLKLPLPPGCFSTLWQDDERFRETYLTRFPVASQRLV